MKILFSKSDGKAVGFEFLIWIWIDAQFEPRISLHYKELTSKGPNLLCKNKKNYLWQVTLSSKHWPCPIESKLKDFGVAGALCTILQSVSTGQPL